jgi:hypothetical protein
MPAIPSRVACTCVVGFMALWPGYALAQHSSLHGIVTDSAGKPVSDADVGVVAHRKLTRTDDQGRFSFPKLPHGPVELSVRRLSYRPATVSVVLSDVPPETLRVTLVPTPAVLSSVEVSAVEVRRRANVEEFYRRRVQGLGTYVTREDIEKRWGGAPSDMLRNTPGIRFVRVVGGGRGVRFPNTSINRRDCAPMIWVDGQKAPGMEIDEIVLADIEGIELYNGPATTPLQFSQGQSSNTCGTIVVWSRPPQYQIYERERKPKPKP